MTIRRHTFTHDTMRTVIAIDTLGASQHQAELREAWNRAAEYDAPGKIEPLH